MAVMDTQPQHMQALDQANRTRLARAKVKRAVVGGERDVADVIRSMPAGTETMTVFDLLRLQHRWGKTRALRFLRRVSLSEAKQLGDMTVRQRELLVAWLRDEDPIDVFPPPTRPRVTVMQRTCRICGAGPGVACKVTRRPYPWTALIVTAIPKVTPHDER